MKSKYHNIEEIENEVLNKIKETIKDKNVEETLISNQFDLIFLVSGEKAKEKICINTPSDDIFEFLKDSEGYSVDAVLKFFHDCLKKAGVSETVGLEKHFVCNNCYGDDKVYKEDEAD